MLIDHTRHLDTTFEASHHSLLAALQVCLVPQHHKGKVVLVGRVGLHKHSRTPVRPAALKSIFTMSQLLPSNVCFQLHIPGVPLI